MEYAPYLALEWARERCEASGEAPAVLVATLHLGRCLNPLDREHYAKLKEAYERLVQMEGAAHTPRNTAAGAHFLDRRLIDFYCDMAKEEATAPHQTVRACFPEGEPIYPVSKLLAKTHSQIAVRDLTCVSRIRLVDFD